MSTTALIAAAMFELYKLARAQGVSDEELDIELTRLRDENQAAHDELKKSIADAKERHGHGT